MNEYRKGCGPADGEERLIAAGTDMTDAAWQTRRAALEDIETQLVADPRAIALRGERAALLDAMGRGDEATQAYLAVLADAPDDAATLNRLGSLLLRTGYRRAACLLFARAAACHPDQPHGHVNLANLLREDADADAARRHYQAALDCVPDLAEAHQGLGNVFDDLGCAARAAHHRRIGYRDRVCTAWPYRGRGTPVRVLLLTSVAGGNLPARLFLDDRVFAVTAVAMEFVTSDTRLPPHDLVFNAIGDADLCDKALTAAAAFAASSAARLINPPQAVLATGREANARRLADIPGVVTPRMLRLSREKLLAWDAGGMLQSAGFAWPMLLRAPGFHTGRHFRLVRAADDLAAAAAALPGDDLLAIEYLDATGTDGYSRKARVMIVEGRLYPLHLAISPDWKVHYFTAGMQDCAAHRAEEARFLGDIEGFLGARAVAALEEVAHRLGLDYAGIDFAPREDGAILLFEANAAMTMTPPPPEAIWAYRRDAHDRAMAAASRMLLPAAFHQPAGSIRRSTPSRQT
jgi:tetratricopeptide (TPR) repeat protein